MSLKDLFSRNGKPSEVGTSAEDANHAKHNVECDTAELKEFITKWTKGEGWEFKDFTDFLELVGVKTPVKLSGYNKEYKSFICLTALNTEVLISLFFGDGWDYCSEIRVTEGEETRIYFINVNSEKGKTVPSATLQRRIIKRNGKELSSFYSEYFCHRTLKFDATHMLEVEIDEPNKYVAKSGISVLRNCTEVENYLLGLDKSLVVSQVYDTVMKQLSFSNEDISNSEKIMFSYIQTVDEEEMVLSKILMKFGEMQEYAILEDGETFHVFRDGSWRYLSGGIKIFYLEEKKHYIFSITGEEEDIINANPKEMMSRVKEKISKLWKFVKIS